MASVLGSIYPRPRAQMTVRPGRKTAIQNAYKTLLNLFREALRTGDEATLSDLERINPALAEQIRRKMMEEEGMRNA